MNRSFATKAMNRDGLRRVTDENYLRLFIRGFLDSRHTEDTRLRELQALLAEHLLEQVITNPDIPISSHSREVLHLDSNRH